MKTGVIPVYTAGNVEKHNKNTKQVKFGPNTIENKRGNEREAGLTLTVVLVGYCKYWYHHHPKAFQAYRTYRTALGNTKTA